MFVKEIAKELSERHKSRIGRNLVASALEKWFTSRGLPVPDGRSRRKDVARKSLDPSLYQRIGDDVVRFMHEQMLLGEVAEQLGVDRNTAAVKHWYGSRGLPAPDGRTRRRALARKSGAAQDLMA